MRARLGRWREQLALRPRHIGLGFFACGLAASSWLPWHFVALAVCAIGVGRLSRQGDGFLGPHRWKWVAVAAALPLGAFIGDARTAALERTALPIGTEVIGTATILELPRADSAGRRSVIAALRGERVLLRPPSWRPALDVDTGELVAVEGRLVAPDLVARARRAHATLLASAIMRTGGRRGGPAGIVDSIRRRAERALAQDLPSPEAGLLRGMVLGQDGALPKDVRDDMRAAGLAHLVAASGANVALLGTLALAAGALAGIPIRARLLAVLGLIALYVVLAGAGPSIQRAGVMGAVAIVSLLASRPGDRWYALLAALAATLALDPRAVSDAGWQMSFAAVVALLLWARPLAARIRAPRPIAEALALTLLATLATAPIAAAHFGVVSLAALPANLIVAPVVAPIMWLGFLAAAVDQLAPALAAPLSGAAAPLVAFVAAVGARAAAANGSQIAASGWPVAIVCAAALLALGLWLTGATAPPVRARTRVALAVTVAISVALVLARPASAPAPPAPGVLRVTALDVGQGDAILVQSGAASVLFDAGVPDAPIVERLQQAGVRRLDAFVITHGDQDHAGGAPAVEHSFAIGRIVDGRRAAPAGSELALGPLRLRFLWPTADAIDSGAEPNELSVVALASAGGRSALLTGDAESGVLLGLELPDVDILKVSHHGSADDGLPELLQRIRPEAALISVGAHNDYGHPTSSTLDALRGVSVHRTDLEGSVAIEASPRGLATFARD